MKATIGSERPHVPYSKEAWGKVESIDSVNETSASADGHGKYVRFIDGTFVEYSKAQVISDG